MQLKIIKNIIYKLITNSNSNINPITKGNNQSEYNNKWDYNHIIYKYNNNNLLNSLKYKYIIKNYISYMLNHKLTSKYINILYKNPIFIYKNLFDIEIILFIYKPYNNNNNNNNSIVKNYNSHNINDINDYKLLTKLINNLINNNNKLSNIIKGYNIKITPIILKYDYLDAEIYSKSLSRFILKNPKFDNINNINLDNIFTIMNTKINNNKLINNIDNILKLYNIKSSNIYDKDIIINNNLLYKYIIGYDWKYKGKNYNSESNARARRFYNSQGQLKTIKSLFKLNNYSANLTKGQSFIINKNGKFNINVTLSHY